MDFVEAPDPATANSLPRVSITRYETNRLIKLFILQSASTLPNMVNIVNTVLCNYYKNSTWRKIQWRASPSYSRMIDNRENTEFNEKA